MEVDLHYSFNSVNAEAARRIQLSTIKPDVNNICKKYETNVILLTHFFENIIIFH